MRKWIFMVSIVTTLTCCNSKVAETRQETVADNTVTLTSEQLKNAQIETGKLDQRNIATLLKVNGTIDVPPQNKISISAPLGGYLKATKLLPGMHIKKGESLAVMEDQQYITIQQDYLAAKAELVFKEEEFNRQRELNVTKAASDKVFQQAQMNFTNQKIQVKALSEKLKLIGIDPDRLDERSLSRSIIINSPIDGYVSHVNVNIGRYVNSSDVLFELVNPSDIHLALNVFEKDVSSLNVGQKLVAYTNTNPEKKYPCEIILIGKNLSAERSVEVHCHFRQYDNTLIPGMYMNADIETSGNMAYVISEDAIVRFEGGQYVFIETGSGKFNMQAVRTGNTAEGYTQVIFPEDFEVKDNKFVIKGAYTLLMRAKNTEGE